MDGFVKRLDHCPAGDCEAICREGQKSASSLFEIRQDKNLAGVPVHDCHEVEEPAPPRLWTCSRMTTARSTAACTAYISTGRDCQVRSCRVSRHAQRLGLSGQKNVGDGQLPDLGMQLFHLLLVNLRSLIAVTFENARRTFQQGLLPCVNHRWMNPEPAGQLSRRLLTLKRLKRHFRLELWRMLLSFQHL